MVQNFSAEKIVGEHSPYEKFLLRWHCTKSSHVTETWEIFGLGPKLDSAMNWDPIHTYIDMVAQIKIRCDKDRTRTWTW